MNYLSKVDLRIDKLIKAEAKRQAETLMMIPSENYASAAVEQAVGSCLGNKYAEGYPKKRYYQGQAVVDQLEQLVINRAKQVFDVSFANVQPHSGSPANAAVYFGLLKPGDTIMGMALSSGGHLTHGHPQVTFSGTFYNSVQYEADKAGWIDYDQVEKLALKHKPKLIICGYTAYPRIIDWKRFASIAKKTGALLMADISHIAGLVAAGSHPSPAPYVHIITTTTHKTLRGPRGAMIMVTRKGLRHDPDMGKKINKAIIPGLQGGPHLNSIAGIGVALKEAQTSRFKKYGQLIVKNAQVLAGELKKHGFWLATDGTDNHLMVADVRSFNIDGKQAAVALEKAGIVVNANTIPHDPNPPFRPSGIRLGTPGVSTRGMKKGQMIQIGNWIKMSLKNYDNDKKLKQIANQVKEVCRQFPIPKEY